MVRNNDGYALPFVLVVMIVICLVGVSILSFSLDNLQSQRASIERMQDQYAAAGKIEEVMAQVKTNKCVSVSTLGVLLAKDNEGNYFNFTEGIGNAEDKLIFTLDTALLQDEFDSSVRIVCKVCITAKDMKAVQDNIDIYRFESKNDIQYLSYEILKVSEGGEENEG